MDTVARATRMEIDKLTGDVYLVFKIIDERFKQKIKDNFNQDIELMIVNKEI
jgi:hypothetical protein